MDKTEVPMDVIEMDTEDDKDELYFLDIADIENLKDISISDEVRELLNEKELHRNVVKENVSKDMDDVFEFFKQLCAADTYPIEFDKLPVVNKIMYENNILLTEDIITFRYEYMFETLSRCNPEAFKELTNHLKNKLNELKKQPDAIKAAAPAAGGKKNKLSLKNKK